MATYENTIPRCVDWLQWQPMGAPSEDVADALGMSTSHVSYACKLAADRGLIGWVHAPMGYAHNRRLYFALKHLPAINGPASRRPSSTLPGKGMQAAVSSVGRWPKRKAESAAPVSGEPVPIICPAGKDNRFTVHEPEKFFSREGYRPDFIGQDTWAAKVYA